MIHNMNVEISAQAALAVQKTQCSGYRGTALLNDPLTRQLILFRSEAWGCDFIARAHTPEHDLELGVTELPALIIDHDLTPDQAFAAAQAEIERAKSRLMN